MNFKTDPILSQTLSNQQFCILHFSSFTFTSQLLVCAGYLTFSDKVYPIDGQDLQESDLSVSPAKSSHTKSIVTVDNNRGKLNQKLDRKFRVLHEERLKEKVSNRVSEEIKYYLQKKDELQQAIIAERALRRLGEKSLELVRDIIAFPEKYPHINTNDKKNAYLEDWLFKHEHFSYCFLKRVPAFFNILIEDGEGFSSQPIRRYFSVIHQNSERETVRMEVLNFINSKLDEFHHLEEIFSDLTSERDRGNNWPRFSTYMTRAFYKLDNIFSRAKLYGNKASQVAVNNEVEDREGEGEHHSEHF